MDISRFILCIELHLFNSFLPAHEDSLLWKNHSNLPHTKNFYYSFMTLNQRHIVCQYAAIDVATLKVIATEVIIFYLGMLYKWKTAVLKWFRLFQKQYEVFIDGLGVKKKIS